MFIGRGQICWDDNSILKAGHTEARRAGGAGKAGLARAGDGRSMFSAGQPL